VSRYQKGKTNLEFTEARDSEWQWHQLDHMQVCTLLQTNNHASTPPLSFLQAGCPSCRPTNSVKELKAKNTDNNHSLCQLNLMVNYKRDKTAGRKPGQKIERNYLKLATLSDNTRIRTEPS